MHLAFASAAGATRPRSATARVAPRATAAVDSAWAPADAARLAEIHLDPPGPLPALGVGRWLGHDRSGSWPRRPGTPGWRPDSAGGDDRVAQRGQLGASARRERKRRCPGAFLLHAVGVAADPGSRARDRARARTGARRPRSPRTSDWRRLVRRGPRRGRRRAPDSALQRLGRGAGGASTPTVASPRHAYRRRRERCVRLECMTARPHWRTRRRRRAVRQRRTNQSRERS